MDVSYKQTHSIPCSCLFLSLVHDRQTTSSGVNVQAAETSLDWWIPTPVVESFFKALAAELGASQQCWHVERKHFTWVKTLQQLQCFHSCQGFHGRAAEWFTLSWKSVVN